MSFGDRGAGALGDDSAEGRVTVALGAALLARDGRATASAVVASSSQRIGPLHPGHTVTVGLR